MCHSSIEMIFCNPYISRFIMYKTLLGVKNRSNIINAEIIFVMWFGIISFQPPFPNHNFLPPSPFHVKNHHFLSKPPFTNHHFLSKPPFTNHHFLSKPPFTNHQFLSKPPFTNHHFLSKPPFTNHHFLSKPPFTNHHFLSKPPFTNHHFLSKLPFTNHHFLSMEVSQQHVFFLLKNQVSQGARHKSQGFQQWSIVYD